MEGKVVFCEGQVAKAAELMDDLDLSYVIRDAVINDPLHFPRRFYPNFCDNPAISAKIEELQRAYGILIYYVTHEITSFGECYSFLYVSQYPEDWPVQTVRKTKEGHYFVQAYVWNVSNEKCSEFGGVMLINHYGMLRRIG